MIRDGGVSLELVFLCVCVFVPTLQCLQHTYYTYTL